MSLSLIRFRHQQQAHWGLLDDDQVKVLPFDCTTTAELISRGYSSILQISVQATEILQLDDCELLSPITSDARVLCQGANYRQHMIDSGMDPDAKNFNMFFTKSSASIHDPVGSIVRPAGVRLLDYEVELTLVLAKETDGEVNVTRDNLADYLAGICIGNDVSARDIQIPQMQFHKGKSYRTFCPLGPVLHLLAPDELEQLNQMQLTLAVNGEVRQSDNTANLVFSAEQTLTEYSQIVDFRPGDVLMTGTPSGCALKLPSPFLVRISALLPEALKWKIFIRKQARRCEYLQPGDIVESSIRSDDGRIDLGCQRHKIIEA